MSKASGLGARLFYNGVNVSGDITAIKNVGGGPAALDCTGIDKSGFERIGGVRDGRLEGTAWFNPAAGAAHKTLSALPVTDQIVTYCHRAAIGAPAASLVGKQVDYAGTRGNDGAFSFDVSAQGAAGVPLEWGELLTDGIRSDTTATNGASLDDGAATSLGLAAYLHVFSLTGTSCTVAIQDSADNATFAAVTAAAFTAATGPGAERIITGAAATIRRYLRVVTTGTFTECSFAVVVVRHEIARDY